jgi:hypothetical protein
MSRLEDLETMHEAAQAVSTWESTSGGLFFETIIDYEAEDNQLPNEIVQGAMVVLSPRNLSYALR